MGQRGQASVEWIALVGVIAAALTAATLALGPSLVPERHQRRPNAVREAYGERTEALVRRFAPGLVYERGLLEAPVDPRTCRVVACARGAAPVLFTHVIHRGATTYVQYWAYWPDSSWHGIAGRHADDWESFQVRIDPDGTAWARASAHHGYTGHRVGPDLNVNQVRPGLVPERWRRGWTTYARGYAIATHSHAGFVTVAEGGVMPTLVPIEDARLPDLYAITPPWRKAVYSDPESSAT
ncbi:MAG: hypothetical protein JWM73_1079 [Solirubrobacterales bacterium]|nr:hypothetical protein [Solirubrobacterales bacterium]